MGTECHRDRALLTMMKVRAREENGSSAVENLGNVQPRVSLVLSVRSRKGGERGKLAVYGG